MQKIIKQVPVYKEVQKGTKEKVVYVANDGTEFEREDACANRDEILRKQKILNNIKRIDTYNDIDVPDVWYYLENEEEADVLAHEFSFNNGYDYSYVDREQSKVLPIHCWIGHKYDDGGDYRGSCNVFTIDYFRQQFNIFEDAFKGK